MPCAGATRCWASCCRARPWTRRKSSPSFWRPPLAAAYSHRLLREHLNALAYAGIRTVHLEVDEGNTPALKLYTRHGFLKVGERKGYYPLPDGSRATALTMSATLS